MEYDKFQDRIIWAQAANLAMQAILAENTKQELAIHERFECWREWFYNELIKPSPRAEKEPMQKIIDWNNTKQAKKGLNPDQFGYDPKLDSLAKQRKKETKEDSDNTVASDEEFLV